MIFKKFFLEKFLTSIKIKSARFQLISIWFAKILTFSRFAQLAEIFRTTMFLGWFVIFVSPNELQIWRRSQYNFWSSIVEVYFQIYSKFSVVIWMPFQPHFQSQKSEKVWIFQLAESFWASFLHVSCDLGNGPKMELVHSFMNYLQGLWHIFPSLVPQVSIVKRCQHCYVLFHLNMDFNVHIISCLLFEHGGEI